METFPALLALCAGNSPVPGEIPTQRPMTQSFDVFFDLRLNKRWVNNGEAGDLRPYRTHYDVTVMKRILSFFMDYTMYFIQLCRKVVWGNCMKWIMKPKHIVNNAIRKDKILIIIHSHSFRSRER